MKIEIDRNDERKLFEAYYCLDKILNGEDKLTRSALYQENRQLKEQLTIREKALELACNYVRDEWEGTKLKDKARKVGGFENYFTEQAKESMK